MVKYFQHETDYIGHVSVECTHKTEKEINEFAEENNLEIVSLSCFGDTGIFVAFKEKS